jgi:hypothetical protein
LQYIIQLRYDIKIEGVIEMTVEEMKLRLEELKAQESRTPEEIDEMAALEKKLAAAPAGGGSLNIGG